MSCKAGEKLFKLCAEGRSQGRGKKVFPEVGVTSGSMVQYFLIRGTISTITTALMAKGRARCERQVS